jgi:uncharacterized protein YegJ (DUF2314 family)
MRIMIAAILLGAASLAGAAPPDHDEVMVSPADDAEMNAARAEAQRRLPEFFAILAAPQANDSTFMLKFDLNRGEGDAEFIWADNVRVSGSQISGRLANNPINPAYAEGQIVVIRRQDINDWGYFRNEVMQGNFTTRVQLTRMPAAQAAQIRRNLGW